MCIDETAILTYTTKQKANKWTVIKENYFDFPNFNTFPYGGNAIETDWFQRKNSGNPPAEWGGHAFDSSRTNRLNTLLYPLVMIVCNYYSMYIRNQNGNPMISVAALVVSLSIVDHGTTSYIGNFSLALINPCILLDWVGCTVVLGDSVKSSIPIILSILQFYCITSGNELRFLKNGFVLGTLLFVYTIFMMANMVLVFSISCNIPSQPMWTIFIVMMIENLFGSYINKFASQDMSGDTIQSVAFYFGYMKALCWVLCAYGTFLNLVRKLVHTGWGWFKHCIPQHFFVHTHWEYGMVPWIVLITQAIAVTYCGDWQIHMITGVIESTANKLTGK